MVVCDISHPKNYPIAQSSQLISRIGTANDKQFPNGGVF